MAISTPAVESAYEAYRVHRAFDYIMIFIMIFLLIGIFHLHAMLTAGDWDFWTDWKDRRWWLFVTPVSLIVFPAVAHYILWEHFRVAFGATLCIVCLLLGQWIDRTMNFVGWVWFPLNFVWPATMIASAIVLDTVLMLTRSYMLTALIGAWLWGILFYPTNWPLIAPFHLPVEYHGTLMSLADVQGFEYIRTGTPEYLRQIEKGTLRTFGQDVTPVSAFFAAFVCVVMYMFWVWTGKFFCTLKFIKRSI